MIRGDEMKCQRGSVTVISLAMLLFLMVVAVAWLPMMTMEKTAAASDYREQQAWNAAEAGYKRAVAQLEAGNAIWKDWLIDDNDLKDGTFSVVNGLGGEPQSGKEKMAGVLENGIWYAVAISSATSGVELKHGERGDGNYTPIPGETYVITSIGSCDGIRKVIRKAYTLGDNGGTGGGVSDDTDLSYMSNTLVMAGGTVKVDKNQHINQDVDIDDSFGGDLYGKNIIDINDNQAFEHNNVKGQYGKDIKTRIPDKVFEQATYPNMDKATLANFGGKHEDSVKLAADKDYYLDASKVIENTLTLDASQSASRTIFIDNSNKNSAVNIRSIFGPESGKPVTLVFSSPNTAMFDGTISGRVRILAAGDFYFGYNNNSTTSRGLLMLLANGNVVIRGYIAPGFVSANGNVEMQTSAVFIGQIQCKGNFSTYGNGKIKFNDTVLKDKDFKVPAGMTAG